MRSTLQSLTIDSLTFKRWHYAPRPGRAGLEYNERNRFSAWETEIHVSEHNDELKPTGELTGVAVRVWAELGVVKVEGAHRMTGPNAAHLGRALLAAATLLQEFNDEKRCPLHGETWPSPLGPDCEGCFKELDPHGASTLRAPAQACPGCHQPSPNGELCDACAGIQTGHDNHRGG